MKKILALILTLTMLMALAACGGSGGNTTADTAADTGSDTDTADTAPADTADEEPADEEPADESGNNGDLIVVGFAQVGHESDWRAANTIDYQTTFTKENGFELIFVDADNDHTAQMEAVRSFIQQEVDYIVICPVQEAGWEVVLQEAQDAGIPVIIADRTVSADPSLYATFLGTDSALEGVTAGNWLAEQLDGAEANILVIEGSTGASAAIGRTNGFNSVAEQHPEWTILDSQDGDFTQTGGQEVMESYLKSYAGQFNVVVCQNDNEAYGAMDAMDAAGVTYGVGGDVIIISFDATHEGLVRTLDGRINCNVECNPLQAVPVSEIIAALEAGKEVDAVTIVPDQAFVAPGIESQYALTMTQEILDGRAY